MKVRRHDWVRLPTAWVQARGLRQFRWGESGGTEIAALMVLMVIAHHADQDDGSAKLTYDQLCLATHLSRAKVSEGLKRLKVLGLIAPAPELGQSGYRLSTFDPKVAGWGMLPARQLYAGNSIGVLAGFKLRSANELNALKIYLLFVARRNIKTNLVNLTYDGIADYTGIDRSRIRQALTVLAVLGLVHADRVKSTVSSMGVANAYRLTHIDPHRHMGTTGRGMDPADFDDPMVA